jgi:sialate O-acetylesterase
MRLTHSVKTVSFCLLVACNLSVVTAEVTLPAIVADHMVLQHGRPVVVWGWADPGETVSITVAGKSASSAAGADRRWQVTLDKLDPCAEPTEMNIQGSSGSQRIVKDVLVGEVWFCTGPSNIFWAVSRCDNAKEEIAAANYPKIRFFTASRKAADTPQADCEGDWVACSPGTVGSVSGVGYFFSRKLRHDLDMPIGMLQSFWGGSRIEAWTSIEALDAQPELKPILDWWAASFAQFDPDKAQAEYDKELDLWKQAAAKAKAEGLKQPGKPKLPKAPRESVHRPACLYNGMVAPLIPYGIRGVISYQGLGNLFWAQYTQPLLKTMINDWRSRWGQGPFPFGMVQPAPFPCDSWAKSSPDAYALQREAQLLLLDTVQATGVAPTTDIGDLKVLHFTNKQEVGRRMALWALATVYGRDVPYSGPIYRSMTIEGNKIRIRFTHTGTGLTTSDGRSPSHFKIAGRDKNFQPATATIDGNTVLVSSERVPKPVAVRFAFNEVDIPNLINREGLPASLFRTDVPLRPGKPER